MRTIYWKLQNTFQNVDIKIITKILENALNLWSEYIDIDFLEYNDAKIPNNNSNFLILSFMPQFHKCQNFDGEGGILAHGTLPTINQNLEIHFDSDERWIFQDKVFNLLNKDPLFYNVALHEIGHTLGLKHNSDLNSIMYSTYSRFITEPSNADIYYLQAIYGARKNPNFAKHSQLYNLIKLFGNFLCNCNIYLFPSL